VPHVHDDYRELLAEHRRTSSACALRPALHPEVVAAAVAAGARAIHCEKPVALTYGEALDMAATAAGAGVQLTFNLQRRFHPVQRQAREWIAQGEIGEVVTIEGYCPNLFDWGPTSSTSSSSTAGTPPRMALGQIDATVDRYVYGYSPRPPRSPRSAGRTGCGRSSPPGANRTPPYSTWRTASD